MACPFSFDDELKGRKDEFIGHKNIKNYIIESFDNLIFDNMIFCTVFESRIILFEFKYYLVFSISK